MFIYRFALKEAMFIIRSDGLSAQMIFALNDTFYASERMYFSMECDEKEFMDCCSSEDIESNLPTIMVDDGNEDHPYYTYTLPTSAFMLNEQIHILKEVLYLPDRLFCISQTFMSYTITARKAIVQRNYVIAKLRHDHSHTSGLCYNATIMIEKAYGTCETLFNSWMLMQNKAIKMMLFWHDRAMKERLIYKCCECDGYHTTTDFENIVNDNQNQSKGTAIYDDPYFPEISYPHHKGINLSKSDLKYTHPKKKAE